MGQNRDTPLYSHRYFAHIDGIRCLAIIPVVMYHLSSSLCPGGFLGVDVFFVISGYLICGGILRDLKEDRFSLSSFYYRRIRRIFPAYFALVIGVLSAGILFYHWARLLPLAQTALFSAGFSTNIYFWLTMGYFQPTSHENPLLHLWSLGVEEQFYIVVPLGLMLLWKIRRAWLMPLLSLGVVGSLIACVVLGELGESTTAFYVLPTRAWELLAGALICSLAAPKDSLRLRMAGLVGVLLVLASYWMLGTGATFGEGGTSVELNPFGLKSFGVVPFPGWVNIPAIVGTMLLIRYGGHGGVGKLLSSKPFVGIGKISYSLYLWHWPIIVFGNYITYDVRSLPGDVTILVLSFLCAYVSWRWVEMPVRLSKTFTMKRAFCSSGIGIAALVVSCGVLVGTEGLREVFHKDANRYASAPFAFMPNLQKFVPSGPSFEAIAFPDYDKNFVRVLGDPNTVPSFCLLGDSHADALAPGLDAVAAEIGVSGYFVDMRMDPYIGMAGSRLPIFEWLAGRQEIKDVYIIDRWLNQYGVMDGLPGLGDKGLVEEVVLSPELKDEMDANLGDTLDWWRARGKRIYLFTCVPEYIYAPADIMARSEIIPLQFPIEILERDYRRRQAPVTRMLGEAAKENGIQVVPLGDAFIENGETVYMAPDGTPYYRDGNHLTADGARRGVEHVGRVIWPDRYSDR